MRHGGREGDALAGSHFGCTDGKVGHGCCTGCNSDRLGHGDVLAAGGIGRFEGDVVSAGAGISERYAVALKLGDTGFWSIPCELSCDIGIIGRELGRHTGNEFVGTNDFSVGTAQGRVDFRGKLFVAIHLLVGRSIGVGERSVVSAHAVAEVRTAIDGDDVALVVGNQALGHHIAAELNILGRVEAVSHTCVIPNADFIVGGIVVVVVAVARRENEVAEATDAFIFATTTGRLGHTAIDVDAQDAVVHHHGNVRPLAHLERTAVGRHAVVGVPPCGVAARSIGVAHELPPSRTGGLVPRGQRVGTNPEFDGGRGELLREDVGDREAILLEVDGHIGGLGDNSRSNGYGLGDNARFVDGCNAIHPTFGGGKGAFGGFAQQFAIAEHLVGLHFMTTGLRSHPSEFAIVEGEVLRHAVLLAIHHCRDDGLFSTGHIDHLIGAEVEGRFHSLLVELIVNHTGVVDMALADSTAARLGTGVDGEEELEGTRNV